MKSKFYINKQVKLEKNVLLFVNGPYQLVVGLACVYTYISKDIIIDVIGYDMRWNKELSNIVKTFAKQFNLSYSVIPFEFKKSDSNYKKTYFVRSIWNQFVIKNYVLFNPANHIFVPKIFNNPERAIVSGARRKNLYVYDDGIGLYINRIVTDQDNKYLKRLDLKKHPKIINICPSNPSLFNISLNEGFLLNTINYKRKMKEIIYELTCNIKLEINMSIHDKNIIILCPSRIAILRSHSSLAAINKIITSIYSINQNIFFVIKPHPRDNPKEIENYFQKIINTTNCTLLEQNLWGIPIEILIQKLKSIFIISGVSTIAINIDFFESSRVIITGVLGEHREDLSYDALQFLDKLDNYIGDNVNSLINIISKEIL